MDNGTEFLTDFKQISDNKKWEYLKLYLICQNQTQL
jgi:hypothetical protein